MNKIYQFIFRLQSSVFVFQSFSPIHYFSVFPLLACLFLGGHFVNAQSTNQSYPTPITANEISGKISARDLGDARLTSYFYTFEGTPGDIFINVVTSNFNGDIDVFAAENLKPLTKITIYADETNNETGRVIYLRQPAKLILRIEGRTPNDEAATFQIKFAGSFAPTPAAAENPNAETPEVKSNNQTDVRVNSVGTIIEIKPKPTPQPKEIIAKKSDNKTIAEAKKQTEETAIKTDEISKAKKEEKEVEVQTKTAEETKEKIAEDKTQTPLAEKQTETIPTVVVTDELAEKDKAKNADEAKKEVPADTKATEETSVAKDETAVVKEAKEQTEAVKEKETKEETEAVKEAKESKKSTPVKALPASALANIRLIILFKDGSKIERSMSEVLKVGVDQGVLTIISKDGAIGRYSILDVEKMTIE